MSRRSTRTKRPTWLTEGEAHRIFQHAHAVTYHRHSPDFGGRVLYLIRTIVEEAESLIARPGDAVAPSQSDVTRTARQIGSNAKQIVKLLRKIEARK